MLSLWAHLLLLLPAASWRPLRTEIFEVPGPVVLNANLRPLSVRAQTADQGRRTPPPAISAEKSSQAVPAKPLVVSEASTQTTPDAPSAAPVSGEVRTSPSAPVGAAASGRPAGSQAQASGREGVRADEMRQYRLSVASAARRFKRYPPLARERLWEGKVGLEVSVSVLLTLPEVSLTHSSGYPLLDEQGLETMRRAVHATPLPEALRGKSWREPFAISFSLENE